MAETCQSAVISTSGSRVLRSFGLKLPLHIHGSLPPACVRSFAALISFTGTFIDCIYLFIDSTGERHFYILLNNNNNYTFI